MKSATFFEATGLWTAREAAVADQKAVARRLRSVGGGGGDREGCGLV